MKRTLAFFVVLLGWAPLVHPHDPGFSTARFALHEQRVVAEVVFNLEDAGALLSAHFGGATAPAGYEDLLPHLLQVRLNDRTAEAVSTSFVLSEDDAAFTMTFAAAEEGWLELSAPALASLPFGHRLHFVLTSAEGDLIAERLWSPGKHAFGLSVSPQVAEPAPTSPIPLLSFLFVGMEHIFIGFDHLLFLFGILLVCSTFRSALRVITAFTVAHSLTLGLATLDLVRLPDSFVEPVIALSIVYVGLENLIRRGEPGNRWPLVFTFGLIHGFGFAGELRESGIGDGSLGSVIGPLLSFNIGVEAGQVLIAAMALPLIWHLRRKPAFVRSGVAYCSAAIVLFGLFWLAERTVFA